VLRLKLLGGLSVQRDGRALTGALAQPRRLAVLALLARGGQGGVPRDRLVNTLWPDVEEERARHIVNQTLYAIRREVGNDEVITGMRELRLNTELLAIDVFDFQAAIAAGNTERAVKLYEGPFLDGFHLPGSDEFERWVERERAGLTRTYTTSLEQLAREATGRGDHTRAVEWWRVRAALDPLDSRVALALMQSLDSAGDRRAAIQHARVYELLIDEELSLPPDRDVVRFAETLRREQPIQPIQPIQPVRPVTPAPSRWTDVKALTPSHIRSYRKSRGGHTAAIRARPSGWTVEKVRRLPNDGNRYEVIDGELFVTPAPSWTHQSVVLELAMILAPYVRGHSVGHVIAAPAEVVFGPRNVVQPDVFVVPLVRGEAPRTWNEVGRLLLAIEVVSPTTRRTDRREKRELYQRKGVPEYWMVNVEARSIERWRSEASVAEGMSERFEWRPDGLTDSLVIDVASLFTRLLGPALAWQSRLIRDAG